MPLFEDAGSGFLEYRGSNVGLPGWKDVVFFFNDNLWVNKTNVIHVSRDGAVQTNACSLTLSSAKIENQNISNIFFLRLSEHHRLTFIYTILSSRVFFINQEDFTLHEITVNIILHTII